MEYQAIGRFLFVRRLEHTPKSKFEVETNADDLTYFEVQSIGDGVENCKPGDKVVLCSGNYEPVPVLDGEKDEKLYIATVDDVAGVIK